MQYSPEVVVCSEQSVDLIPPDPENVYWKDTLLKKSLMT